MSNIATVHILLLAVVVLSITQTNAQIGIKRSSHGKTALFRKISANIKLNSTPITGYSNCSFRDCGKYCAYKIPCESFNFKTSTKECELLTVDRNSRPDNITFINATGWAYYDTGFNIRHPNWRNKYLYNISCPVNKCDKCTCLQPPEEETHQCDCYSKEGLIKLAAGNWCWYVNGECSVSDGEKVLIRPCDKNDVGQQFMYDGQRHVFHKCSQKSVCFNNNSLVVNETCSHPWYMTDYSGLSLPLDICPYPLNGLVESYNELVQSINKCNNETGIQRFQNGVDGRIQVKLFKDMSSIYGLTHIPKYTNTPDAVAWFHQFYRKSYGVGMEFFGRQFKTVFLPPETGSYIFYMEVDDQGKLYITHPNSTPNLLISRSSYTTSILKSATQSLLAFEKYSIEALMFDYGSIGYLAVGVEFPDGRVEYPLTEKYLLPPN
ncbi:uncharacterized protein LOC130629234 [Hydractinia symbiolongicarpus]|uniref:uncharacterized protein LOC130629234 n=1 Tax=Hydractinia symbiolongicarpus TaxID=13093 RepID=UPI00254B0A24|nr:uncharacterized protein LOC130629234 [Hydractinia symbiolongicarpus]